MLPPVALCGYASIPILPIVQRLRRPTGQDVKSSRRGDQLCVFLWRLDVNIAGKDFYVLFIKTITNGLVQLSRSLVPFITIQHFPNFSGQRDAGEWLLDEIYPFIQNTLMGYDISCIA